MVRLFGALLLAALTALLTWGDAAAVGQRGWRCATRCRSQASSVCPGTTPFAVGKLHVVLLMDTDASDESGLKFGIWMNAYVAELNRTIDAQVPADRMGFRVTLQATDCTAAKALQALRDAPVAAEDVVYFHYNGHGHYDEAGQYFPLTYGPLLRRAEVTRLIADKAPRHGVVLVDSCNTFAQANVTKAQASPTPSTAFRDLMFQHRGLTDVNSCKKDQFSQLGVFTPCFTELCNNANSPGQWAQFFPALQQAVLKKNKHQEPTSFSLGVPDFRLVPLR